MNTITEKKRLVYLDLIRVIATFCVIIVHVFARDFSVNIGSYNWFISALGCNLFRWGSPLFVMISGVIFLQPTKQVSYSILLKKHIPRLLLAYAFWNLVYILYEYIVVGQELSIGLFYPHFHLWYIPMIIGVYLLIPILRKIANDKNLMRSTLILWGVYITGCFCRFDLIPQIGAIFKSNSVFGYAGYFLLGYYLSNCTIKKKQIRWIYGAGVLGTIICVGGVLITSYITNTANTMFINNLSPHRIVVLSAVFIFIKQITPKIENKVIAFIEYVRKDLFGIYLVHGLWLLVINIPMLRDLCNHVITLPLISIVIFILSLYTTKLIRLIPLLKKTIE